MPKTFHEQMSQKEKWWMDNIGYFNAELEGLNTNEESLLCYVRLMFLVQYLNQLSSDTTLCCLVDEGLIEADFSSYNW